MKTSLKAASADPLTTLIDTASDVDFPLFDGIHFDPTAQTNIGAAAYSIFNP